MRKKLVIGLLLAAMVSLSPAQGLFESSLENENDPQDNKFLTIGGFIRSALYLGETPEEEVLYLQSAYAQTALQIRARAGQNVNAFMDLRFRYGSEWQQGISEMEIREAYVDLETGPASFRLGKIISPWGKGTVFNPVNKMTPMDPTVRSPDTDDMNLGSWALQGSLQLGSSLKLTATWNPLYQPGKLLIDPVPMPAYLNFVEADYPGVKLNEGSYGLKMDLRAPALDAALYWFQGYHSWPGIAFSSYMIDSITMQPVALNVMEKAYRIRMVGADLSVPAGAWIIRAEGAWFKPLESHEGVEYLPFPELSYTAEIETGGNWLTLIAGYYGKYILDFLPVPEISPDPRVGLASFNRLYSYQEEEVYHSTFLVLKGDFLHNQLELSLPLIYHITTGEWIVQPSISWMPADGFKMQAGYNGLWGEASTLYDMVGPVLNAGYLSMTLIF